jgi:hypothetical protein
VTISAIEMKVCAISVTPTDGMYVAIMVQFVVRKRINIVRHVIVKTFLKKLPLNFIKRAMRSFSDNIVFVYINNVSRSKSNFKKG